jgi:NitT/TauT family transport system substrate-binding protein
MIGLPSESGWADEVGQGRHQLALPARPDRGKSGVNKRHKQRKQEEELEMAVGLKRVKVAPKGMGLNDFVAMQEGFFAAEGLDVEFDWKTFRGTQSSWKGLEYFQRPQDRPYTEDKRDVVQGACLWGTICNASAGMGRVVTEGYGDSPWAIFVRPDSRIRKPEDLKDVPISVGMRAGSHFNVPYRLEKYLPLEHIKTVNTGGFGARLRALLDGEVDAASLLPPQIPMAEQLGLRKIIEDRFKTLWWVPESATADVVHGYMRALSRAEQAMDADLAKYLPLWTLAVPAEFENYHPWDFSKFGRGERFVNKPLPRGEFDEVFAQVERWGLDQYLKDRSPETLSYSR